MSNLIMGHSLPNANHRTAIAMLQFCIESIDASFRMPQTHIDDEYWQAWANEYIRESKRLITVRRNHLRFHDLARLDIDIVKRKGGIEIPLSEYTLDISIRKARRRYAEQHEIHCRQFATEILAKADREDLVTERGPSRSEFREYLEIGVLEHDFGAIFD